MECRKRHKTGQRRSVSFMESLMSLWTVLAQHSWTSPFCWFFLHHDLDLSYDVSAYTHSIVQQFYTATIPILKTHRSCLEDFSSLCSLLLCNYNRKIEFNQSPALDFLFHYPRFPVPLSVSVPIMPITAMVVSISVTTTSVSMLTLTLPLIRS